MSFIVYCHFYINFSYVSPQRVEITGWGKVTKIGGEDRGRDSFRRHSPTKLQKADVSIIRQIDCKNETVDKNKCTLIIIFTSITINLSNAYSTKQSFELFRYSRFMEIAELVRECFVQGTYSSEAQMHVREILEAQPLQALMADIPYWVI